MLCIYKNKKLYLFQTILFCILGSFKVIYNIYFYLYFDLFYQCTYTACREFRHGKKSILNYKKLDYFKIILCLTWEFRAMRRSDLLHF